MAKSGQNILCFVDMAGWVSSVGYGMITKIWFSGGAGTFMSFKLPPCT